MMNLNYEIIYSDRKTLNITLDREGKIIVRAPQRITKGTIEKILQKKSIWLFDKLKSNQKISSNSSPKEFVPGESLLFLGYNYKLLISNDEFIGIIFNNDFSISYKSRAKAKELFKKWYIEKAKEIFSPKVELFSKELGVNPIRLVIKSMSSSWGSCSPNKTITLNWKLIKAPIYVINYIIVHELTHLIELNHSSEFWNIISVQVPNYNRAKSWLKIHGDLLERNF
jgi:hypothetical protein